MTNYSEIVLLLLLLAVFEHVRGGRWPANCGDDAGLTISCSDDPCVSATCPQNRQATCRFIVDECGRCVAIFSVGGRDLTDAECNGAVGSGPIAPCPDGSTPVTCTRNPCDTASCEGERLAKCRVNRCGSCTAEFYVGQTRISNRRCAGIGPCPPDVPQAGCMNAPGQTCLGQSCRMFPDAECVIDGCGGCTVIFVRNGRRLTKEECDGCPRRSCRPCENAVCPTNPSARCEEERCRKCKASFYGPDNRKIESCCQTETCPDGSTKFRCLKNPCDVATCQAVPSAVCKPDYCGGCKAKFVINPGGIEITEDACRPLELCPAGAFLAKCQGDMCEKNPCSRYPGATCQIDGCNGCRTVYYYDGRRLTEEDCNGCPNSNRVAACGNPCNGSSCGNARCEPQVCGQCRAKFFGADRREVTTCGTTQGCSGGLRRIECSDDPCNLNFCPGVSNAECRPNYCGGCHAEFYYQGTNTRIPDYVCVEKEMCPGDLPLAGCASSEGLTCMGETCPNYPEAQCHIDSCNGCTVIFYVGRRRLTREDCHGCPTGVEKKQCGNPCKDALCALYPTARCEPRMCGQCGVVFYGLDRKEISDCCTAARTTTTTTKAVTIATTTITTSPVTITPITTRATPPPMCPPTPFPPRQCLPCSEGAKCPEISSARCEDRRCGMCKAAFFDSDGTEIQSCCQEGERCDDGKRRFQCRKNPCDDATCLGNRFATCRPNYCGGCKAEFFSSFNNMKLSEADCIVLDPCPPSTPLPGCRGPDKCLGQRCPNYPNAECKLDACGSCHVVFFDGRKRLTDEDCNGCGSLIKAADCDDPCEGASCPNDPEARCEPRRCGVCRTVFIGRNRKQVANCGGSFCPDGKRRFDCFENPCQVKSCPGYPDATCTPDFCGGCNAIFRDRAGNKLSDFACVEKEPCPGDLPVAGCTGPGKCIGSTCKNYPNAECWIDGCNGCNVVFYNGAKRLTDEDCNGCPAGQTKADDCANPCLNALCPLYPTARCEARRCGVCRPVFFSENRKEIKDCCGKAKDECPPDQPISACKKNPCDGASCPAELLAECRPNYCGGCKAEFFIGNRKLSNEQCGLCANGKAPINCGIVPQCFQPVCKAFPNAICRSTNCGECREWFEDANGKVVNCDATACPADKPLQNCLTNPCDRASCPAVPQAICKPNYCGECKAEFFINSRKLSNEQCGLCANGKAPINCGIVPQCFQPVCKAFPDAICRSTNCGECREWFEDANGKVVNCDATACPADKPIRNCFRNPCDGASCAAVPQAVCKPNYCGECKAEFFDGMRKLTDYDCIEKLDRCAAFTTCFVGDGSCTCGNRQNVRCVLQFCPPNSCKTAYFDNNGMRIPSDQCGTVTTTTPSPFGCPPDKPPAQCRTDPCTTATCPGNTQAVCRLNFCGGCFPEFYFNGKKLSDIECVERLDRCAAFTTCPTDVCNCPAVQNSQCIIQFCAPNSCKPLYFDAKGKKLSNTDCGLCEDGTERVNCGIVPQCRFSTCPAHPNAKCRATNCGICREWWEDENGKTVKCQIPLQCAVPQGISHGSVSPSGRRLNIGEFVTYACNTGFQIRGNRRRRCVVRRRRAVLAGSQPRCFDRRCPSTVGSFGICQTDCSSNSDCGFNRLCCWNGCAAVCTVRQDVCPGGGVYTQCFADPCQFASCPGYPDAKCVANYCGGCFADWYQGNTKIPPGSCDRADPRCPSPSSLPGICVDGCLTSADCSITQICCRNSCGNRYCYGYA